MVKNNNLESSAVQIVNLKQFFEYLHFKLPNISSTKFNLPVK